MDKLKMSLGAIYLALKSRETPVWLKLATLGTVIYILSPLDLIPDVPFLGYLDDVTLLSILIYLLKNGIPKDIMRRSREEMLRKIRTVNRNSRNTVDSVMFDYDESDKTSGPAHRN